MDRRSTIRCHFKFIGSHISLCSRKKSVVDLSWCDSEYIVGFYVACQTISIDSVLNELKIEFKILIKLQINNKLAISLEKNLDLHGKSKHIETMFYFLREQVNWGKLEVAHCPISTQVTNVLTKGLKTVRLWF